MAGVGFSVPCPQATDDMIGLAVRGYTMGGIRDGWLVFIRNNETKPHDLLQDDLCVVKTHEGRMFLRFVRKGRRPDRWDLLSVTGDPMMDVELRWCEKVQWIQPYRLSQAQIDSLGTIPDGELSRAA